jgi:hypothetical protein
MGIRRERHDPSVQVGADLDPITLFGQLAGIGPCFRHGIKFLQGHVQGFRNENQRIHLGQPHAPQDLRKGAFVDGVFVRKALHGLITAFFDDFPDVLAEPAPDFRVFFAQDGPKSRETGWRSSG